jgi:hypothetical protein
MADVRRQSKRLATKNSLSSLDVTFMPDLKVGWAGGRREHGVLGTLVCISNT